MITEEQQIWLDHLNDTDKVEIFPYDETSEEKFQKVKKEIQDFLGAQYPVEHRGASSLKISGQNEIDVYLPIVAEKFNELIISMEKLYGKPKSHYPLKRARFVRFIDDKRIDIFVVNADGQGWTELVIFHDFLLSHPRELENYKLLKESLSGLSTRKYYQKKIEFINSILVKAS
jgi:GrpB-like predicted nucleotidyltransferase (UPF0157 family)